MPALPPLQNAYVSGRRADAEHIFLNGNFSRDNRGRIAYKYAVSAVPSCLNESPSDANTHTAVHWSDWRACGPS